uniref:Myotubularin phosphatase domain-containing protein n=1 Tax=Alexandrium monilatum TaxID=311494 RepID=A0A7S4SLR4_9DINO
MDPLSVLLDKKKTEQASKPAPAASAAGLSNVSSSLAAEKQSTLAMAASLGSPSRSGDLFPDELNFGPGGLPSAPNRAPAVSAASGAPLTGVEDFIDSERKQPNLGPGSANSTSTIALDDMLPGERVFVVASNCFLLVRNPLCEVGGRLLVTNYRLKFQTPKGTLREELRWMLDVKYFDVPLGAVEELREDHSTTATGAVELRITVQTKDFRSLALLMRSEDDWRNVLDAVGAFGTPGNPALLFAFKHAEACSGPEQPDGWGIYDPVTEYTRMGIETEMIPSPGSPWLVSRINAQYALCASYPALLALPRRMTEHELKVVAGFRKRGRLPAMSWCGGPELQFASLWRCSQTTEGIMGMISQNQRCAEDQKMVEVVRRGADPQAERDLLVIDLRPWRSAWANKAGGGGFEGYPRCKLVFGNIDNIHCVREAWRAMGKAVSNVVEGEPGTWMRDVANSCWYDYMGAILNSTRMVVTELFEHRSSALVHCSDGWDRTAQVCSLAMMCLDPHYRTQEGLLRLVQKEWCSFGHRFRTRLALGEVPSGEYSPVFIQWLDCAYQLFRQYPSAFEWTPGVLLRLAQEAASNRYGTFLCDSERERAERVRPHTRSLWSALLRPEEASGWFNWDYRPTGRALVPNVCQANYAIWDAYWFRYHLRGQRPGSDAARPADPAPGAAPAAAAAPEVAAAGPPPAAAASPPPPPPAAQPQPAASGASSAPGSEEAASLFSPQELASTATAAPQRRDVQAAGLL